MTRETMLRSALAAQPPLVRGRPRAAPPLVTCSPINLTASGGCGCCETPGTAVCGCTMDYFDTVSLTMNCVSCPALHNKVFLGIAGAPNFLTERLMIDAATNWLLRFYAGDLATSACSLSYVNNLPMPYSSHLANSSPSVNCATGVVSWSFFGTNICGPSFISFTATMQPCTVTAPSGVCGGLVVPGAPVLTIAGCDGSLDGSWPMVPNFSVGTSIYGPVVDSLLSHFDGWVTFGHGIDYGFGPGGAGLDLGDGHHLFAKVTLMGNIAITVRRDSDGATATATTVGSTACAPFQITAAMNLFGADTPVVCPGNPFTVTITA